LLVTEMGFWWSCVRKALEDKVWNEEIREGWSRTNYERWDRWRMTEMVPKCLSHGRSQFFHARHWDRTQ
jgi:hypothetical protein